MDPLLVGRQFLDDPVGTVVEICPAMRLFADQITHRIKHHGGAALVVDYGNWRSKGDTLQAVRRHKPEHPLANPGEADLTAHVDFEAMTMAAMGLPHTGLTDQGALLARLGIHQRAEKLAANLTGAALENHLCATQRLTAPAEMGTLFKALALHAPGSPPPPGFD